VYISAAKDGPFLKRVLEMARLSLRGVALRFLSGWLLRGWAGVEV
jgi:hypothetical protein